MRQIFCINCIFFFILQTFFNSGAMRSVRESFCIYHITAPGQESGSEELPEGYVYPTMDELSEQVNCLQINKPK